MSSLFSQNRRNSTLSNESTPLEASQSSHEGGDSSNTSAAHRDRGGADFHDKQSHRQELTQDTHNMTNQLCSTEI